MNTFAGGGGGAGGGDGGSADLRYSVDWHGYGGTLNQKGSGPNFNSVRVESYTYVVRLVEQDSLLQEKIKISKWCWWR